MCYCRLLIAVMEMNVISPSVLCLLSAHLDGKDMCQFSDVNEESSSILHSTIQSRVLFRALWVLGGLPVPTRAVFFFPTCRAKGMASCVFLLRVKKFHSQRHPGNLLCPTGHGSFHLLISQLANGEKGMELRLSLLRFYSLNWGRVRDDLTAG